jgi:hypothetical protein
MDATPNDFAAIAAMWEAYRAAPLVLCAATAAVILYAARKFGQPTKLLRDNESILPPRQPAVQTTYLRYRVSLGLYVLLWLAFFSAFVFVPPIFAIMLELLDRLGADFIDAAAVRDLLVTHQGKLPYVLPVLAFVFMYLIAKAPIFSHAEEHMRDGLNTLAKIPLEAMRMSAELRERRLIVPKAYVERLEAEPGRGNIRAKQRALYDLWLRLRYVIRQLESWSAHPDYSRFALRYPQERTALVASKDKLEEGLSTLDSLLGIGAPLAEVEAQKRAVEIEVLLRSATTFLCYGVLSSFATRRARQEALECIGFAMDGREVQEEFPLDSASLALVLVPIFLVIVSFSVVFVLIPSRLFATEASVIDRLGFAGCLRWGFWGMIMHLASIVAVLMVRRAMAGTPLRAWLEGADDFDRPYGMYLFCGAVAFVTGGAIALLASLIGPYPFTWTAFAWGAVTFITGVSIIWHIDDSKAALAATAAEQAPLPTYVINARTCWRIVVVQGAATAAFSMFANLYALDQRAVPVDWKFFAFLLVTNFAVGAFLAHHLHRSFVRRQTRKRVVGTRTRPSEPDGPTPSEPLPVDVLPASGT